MKYGPYSFSKMSMHQNCANRFKLTYIDKIKTPWIKTKALEKGKFIHHIIEKKLLNEDVKQSILDYKITEHESYKDLLPLVKYVLSAERMKKYEKYPNKYVEYGFGLYIDEKSIELGTYKKTNGVSPLIRGYIDLMIDDGDTIIIIDHKTGKYKEDQNQLQLLIYFLVAVLKFPNANKFIVQFDFIEHDKEIQFEFTRNMFQEKAKIVMEAIVKIETDTKFEKDDTYCNWCQFYGKYCNGISNKGMDIELELPTF